MANILNPNCDMDWEIYLDYLADQGFDELRNIDICSLVCSNNELSSYHGIDFDSLNQLSEDLFCAMGCNQNTFAFDLMDMEEDGIIEDYFVEKQQLEDFSRCYDYGCGFL